MPAQSVYHTFQRYRTLYSNRITALPIVILMPHSACNCRCVMCDIWKGNKNGKQLTQNDLSAVLVTLKKLQTKQVVMSGGEALLNANFFRLCEILRRENIQISLLSTGLLLKKNAGNLLNYVNDIIVSLDGSKKIHDEIRNIPGAFDRLQEGVMHLHSLSSKFRITGRTVIHRLNFRNWEALIQSALDMGLQQISFLPADVSSHAFNREQAWDFDKQTEILIGKADLPELQKIIDGLTVKFSALFSSGFIAESPAKLQKIHEHYSACYGLNAYPFKKCNAPWVSAVIEADGSVRPCFFHEVMGNIHQESLDKILNSAEAIYFRKNLDTGKNSTCKKCVCYLNLPPAMNPAAAVG